MKTKVMRAMVAAIAMLAVIPVAMAGPQNNGPVFTIGPDDSGAIWLVKTKIWPTPEGDCDTRLGINPATSGVDVLFVETFIKNGGHASVTVLTKERMIGCANGKLVLLPHVPE